MFLLVRLSGFRLDSERVPDTEKKGLLLEAIDSAQRALPLAVALRVLGLAPARFHAWRSLADSCGLADRASCPHTTPTQLTAEEVATIGSMVLPYIKQDEDWFVAEKAAILHDIIDGAGGHNGVMYQNSMEPLKPSSVDWTRKPCVSSSNFRR
ncbi:MAG: hypothetical protein ABSB49_20080 [Polyangia bacterium]